LTVRVNKIIHMCKFTRMYKIMPSRKDRSRCLILNAAESTFRDMGFGNVSMEEIAQRAGLSRKTIYNLFVSKEEIVAHLVMRVEADADSAYRARMAANENALHALEEVFLSSARWCLANPTIAPLALAGHRDLSASPPSGRPSLQGLVGELLRLGQRQGAIREDEDPDKMAMILLGAYAQMMLYALAGGPFEAERGIKYLLRLVIEGIGAQSSNGTVPS
jgi:TetR/AcrR family transcriptional regulator, regulator of autoinduction and epiphytic fitness